MFLNNIWTCKKKINNNLLYFDTSTFNLYEHRPLFRLRIMDFGSEDFVNFTKTLELFQLFKSLKMF